MHTAPARLSLLFLLVNSFPALHADPADEAVAAVLKLRAQPGYSWDVSTSKPGSSVSVPPRTKHGSITATGEMMLELIWADGRSVETIIRPDGTGVVKATDGWKTKNELMALSRSAKRGGPESSWVRLALASLECKTVEEELTRLLNEAKGYERTGDKISAVLTDRGASFWLGSARLIPDATGTLQLRMRDGLIRECRISAEGDRNMGAKIGSATTPVAFECTMTFSYSTPPSVPFDAKQKLNDAGSAPPR
jgi:hypothetical protein